MFSSQRLRERRRGGGKIHSLKTYGWILHFLITNSTLSLPKIDHPESKSSKRLHTPTIYIYASIAVLAMALLGQMLRSFVPRKRSPSSGKMTKRFDRNEIYHEGGDRGVK